VDYAFGNSLVVEVLNLLKQDVIFKK